MLKLTTLMLALEDDKIQIVQVEYYQKVVKTNFYCAVKVNFNVQYFCKFLELTANSVRVI